MAPLADSYRQQREVRQAWIRQMAANAQPLPKPIIADYDTGRNANPEDYVPYDPVTGRPAYPQEPGEAGPSPAIDPDPMEFGQQAPKFKGLSPDEIDAIDLSQATRPPQGVGRSMRLSPEQIDSIDLPPARDITEVPQMRATQGGPPLQVPDVAASPFDELEGPVSSAAVGIARTAGSTLGAAGKGVAAMGEDIMEAPAQIAGYQQGFRNLRSLGRVKSVGDLLGGLEQEQPTPFEQQTAQTKGVERFARTAATGLLETEPRLAAGFALGAVGVPPAMAAALPMVTTDKGEFDPVGAAIAAGLPGVQGIGEDAVAKALSRLPIAKAIVEQVGPNALRFKKVVQNAAGIPLSNDTFRKFLEQGGGYLLTNAYLAAADGARNIEELQHMTPEQRGQWILDLSAQNLAPALLGFLHGDMSKTFQRIKPELIERLKAEVAKGPPPAPPVIRPQLPPAGSAPEEPTPTGPQPTGPEQPGVANAPSEQGTVEEAGGNKAVSVPGPGQGATGTVPPVTEPGGTTPPTVPTQPPAPPVTPPAPAPEQPKGPVTAKDFSAMKPEEFVTWKKDAQYGPDSPAKIAAAWTPDDLKDLVPSIIEGRNQAGELLQQMESEKDPAKQMALFNALQVLNLKVQTLTELGTSIPGVAEKSKLLKGDATDQTLMLLQITGQIKPVDLGKTIRDFALQSVLPVVSTPGQAEANHLATIEPAVKKAYARVTQAVAIAGNLSDAQRKYLNEFDAKKFSQAVLNYAKTKGIIKPAPAAPPPPKPPEPPKSKWKPIGKNANGADLFEDENGVRSYVENGVRVTEPVHLIPTREGIKYGVGERGPEFTPAEAKAPRKAGDMEGMTDEELKALMDEAFAEEPPKPKEEPPKPPAAPPKPENKPKGPSLPRPKTAPKPKPEGAPAPAPQPEGAAPREKTPAEIAAEMAKHGVKGVDEAVKALHDLFGGGAHTGSGGPGFDEETYKKAKPHFERMWEEFKAAGRNLIEFLKAVRAQFGLRIRPYIERFIQELREGPKETTVPQGETGTGSNVGGGTRPPGGTVPGASGGAPPTEAGATGTQGVSGQPGTGSLEGTGQTGKTGTGTDGGQTDGAQGLGGSNQPGVQPGQPENPQPEGGEGTGGVPPKVGPAPKPEKPKTSDPNALNHVIQSGDTLAPSGKVGKLKANIAAIELVNKLYAENRNATPEEKKKLAQYSGWGALSQAFDEAKGQAMERHEKNPSYWNPDYNEKWATEWGKWYRILKDLLTDDEWRAAARSTQYAHFTSMPVVRSMWDIATRMGFVGGTMVERAAGIGHMIGLAPEALRDSTQFVAIERDPLSAKILAKLYPEAKVFNKDTAEVKIPPGSVDLQLTNVPFSSRIVDDKKYPVKLNLHNWFIAKMLDDTKPGGLVITITSGHTMDSQSAMRQYLANRAELIGALRLPNTAFKENAGTEVTTDILILRKPLTPTPQMGQPWANLKEMKTYDGRPVMVNEYFADHPEMILGRPSLEGTMHAGREEYATLPFEDKSLEQAFQEAIAKLPKDVFGLEPAQAVDFSTLGEAAGVKENTLVVREGGTLAMAKAGRFVDPKTESEEFAKPERVKQARSYVDVSSTYRDLLALQVNQDATDEQIEAARKKLNEAYDAYVKKYGVLNGKRSDYLDFEHNYHLVMGLERENINIDPKTDKVTKTYTKSDIFTKRTTFPKVIPDKADNVLDALQISLSYRGMVDMPFIAKLTNMSQEDAEHEMLEAGHVFRNPENSLIETKEQYLSGDVRRKLKDALAAADDDEQYKPNVEALQKAQPADKPFRKIRVMLGATWMPSDIVTNFAKQLFGSTTGGIVYSETADMWVVGGFDHTPELTQRFGTDRKDGEEILSSILNQKTIKIYDTITVGDSERRVFNQKETQKIKAIAEKMEAAFESYLRSTPELQNRVVRAFNDTANNYVLRSYAVDRLDLPGLSRDILLRANQRNAVWRFVQERHGVGAETVGAGKTFIQICTAMECRRLGLAKKPMIAVMNSTLGQFAQAFRKLYPGANVLVAGRQDLAKDRRKKFLGRIASGDWDAVIIPHSQFNMLEDDPAWEQQMINQLLDELVIAIREARANFRDQKAADRDPTVKALEKQKEKFEEKLQELANRHTEDLITFQNLGVDLLMIDEAHEFKKPPFTTKRDNIAGLSKEMSERALSLFLKARYVQSKNGGRGVIGFTGTPVTNTLGEAWHMLNLFSPQLLKEFHVETFDRFLSTFARVSTDFDVNAVGNLVLKDKLSRFVNLSELVRMIRSSWDVVTQDDLRPILEAQGELYPKIKGGKTQTVAVPLSPAVAEFNRFLTQVFNAYGNLTGQDKKLYSYVPVLCFLAGKAAALDIRLVDPTAKEDEASKINIALKDVFRVWNETKEQRLTQAIFLDQMNPFTRGVAKLREFAANEGITYNPAADKEAEPAEDMFLYRDMRDKLIAMGVPEKEIMIVNEHDTKAPDAFILFDKINRGDVRIVIGSTAKMGVGVNMQKRLYKLHHLDVPWYPALLEQRNGRIERSNNINPEIEIAYYGMERTADVGLYAKNEAKAKFSSQVLSGRVDAEEIDDPSGALIMSMAEQMAALSGDPLIFEKVQLENRIRTLRMQYEAFVDDQESKGFAKERLLGLIDQNKKAIATKSAVLEWAEPNLGGLLQDPPKVDAVIGKTPITDKKALIEAMTALANKWQAMILRRIGEKAYGKPGRGGFISLDADMWQEMGTINGARITARWSASMVQSRNEKNEIELRPEVELDWISTESPKTDKAEAYSLPTGYAKTPIGIFDNLAEIPQRLKSSIESDGRSIDQATKEIAEIDRLLQAKFAGAEELATAEARYQELRNTIENANTPPAQKAAELLFETGLDPDPLLVRLRRLFGEQSALVETLKAKAAGSLLMEHGEFGITRERFKSDKEYTDFVAKYKLQNREDVEKWKEAKARLQDIRNRLAIVEKARMEAEQTGDAWLLPFGRTPSSHPGIAYDLTPPDYPQTPSPVEQREARGLDEIRNMLETGQSGLPQEAVEVALALLDTPVMRSLDWSGLTLRVGDVQGENGPMSGRATVGRLLIELAKGARASTFPHEVFHFLWHLLPAEVRKQVNDFRLDELQELLKTAPPEVLPLIQRMLEQDGLSSQEYLRATSEITTSNPKLMPWLRQNYYLSNPGEYLSGVAGERFARKRFEARDKGLLDSLWAKLKSWVNGLLDVFRRLKPNLNRIIDDLLAGKYRSSMEEGAQAEADVYRADPKPPVEPEDNDMNVGDLEMGDFSLEHGGFGSTTKRMSVVDRILGREGINEGFRSAGKAYAASQFAKAGLQVEEAPDGFWQLMDPGFESEVEGERLLKLVQDDIATQQNPARGQETGELGHLLNSIRLHFAQDDVSAFSEDLKARLYATTQGEASHRGIMLAALAALKRDIQYVAMNIRTMLTRTYADTFGGEFVRKVLARIAADYRSYFTEAEIDQAIAGDPRMADFLDRAFALNRREEGGQVYRQAQKLLKEKRRKTLGRLESDARVKEAVRTILQVAAKHGIEPKPSPNKPLSPVENLLLMVTPKTAAKIEKAINIAFDDAARNAGIKQALLDAEDEDERQDLLDRFSAGEEPTPEQIEQGLTLPEFAHWKVITDNFLGYNPVTTKLAQDLIRADFKGTQFRNKPTQRPEDNRIDLELLAKSPQEEVKRVLDAYMKNLEANTDVAHATPQTKQRVMSIIETELVKQLESARERVRAPLFRPPAERGVMLTPEQRLGQIINAGLFSDPRLDLPEMVQRVAAKSTLQKLVPKPGEMVKLAMETPAGSQTGLAQAFAMKLIRDFGLSVEQGERAAVLFEQAFQVPFEQARKKAIAKTLESLTPKERKAFKPGKAIYEKVVAAVNAGTFDAPSVLREVARANGWAIPSEGDIQRFKDLADRIQKLQQLTPEEKAEAGNDPEALRRAQIARDAVTLEKRAQLNKQISALWARMSQPLTLRTQKGRHNIAASINEFEVANLLLKAGFAIRLPVHIVTQLFVHMPTRAIAAVMEREHASAADVFSDLNGTLRSSYTAAFKGIRPALESARAALAGRGEARNVDRLATGILAFERMELKAAELDKAGESGKAFALRLLGLAKFSLRFVQAVDNFQGVPAEYAELDQAIETGLRERGMSPAEIVANKSHVLGGLKEKQQNALIIAKNLLDLTGEPYTASELEEAAWDLVKAIVYEDIRGIGLPADDIRAGADKLRRVIAWQEKVQHGPGGVVAAFGRGISGLFSNWALPFSFTRFANAVGTGINYSLMFTPLYFMAAAKLPASIGGTQEPSPWFATEKDRYQRRVMALLGSMIGAMVIAAILKGAMRVWLRGPQDKEERDLWEAQGHRAGTIEIVIDKNRFIPLSLTVGPASIIAPYAAAAGALVELLTKRAKMQAKLEEEALKKGLPAGKIRPIDALDMLTVAAEAFWGTMISSRALTGVVQSTQEFGIPNVVKTAAAFVSPTILGLPGWQEFMRMAGVNMDAKLAGFWDYMLMNPWSKGRAVNMMGDPVKTPDDVQRIIQTITAGSYPGIVDSSKQKEAIAYAALLNSGYRPPSIEAGHGFEMPDGTYRPMNDSELADYAVSRGKEFKAQLSDLGPDATAQDAKAAFQRANEIALARLGIAAPVVRAETGGTQSVTPVTEATRYVSPGVTPMAPSGSTRLPAMGKARGAANAAAALRRGLRGIPKSIRGPRGASLRARGAIRAPVRRGGAGGGFRSLRPRH